MNLEELNPQQRKAVEITGGPILIFAGAGSGKTRVLTHKIAYLVKEIGLPPDNILAVTFTNKAADEMKQRVQELLNMDVSSMSVGTFHSISARILRREIQLLGYSNDFVIYDQDDSRALVKTVKHIIFTSPKASNLVFFTKLFNLIVLSISGSCNHNFVDLLSALKTFDLIC